MDDSTLSQVMDSGGSGATVVLAILAIKVSASFGKLANAAASFSADFAKWREEWQAAAKRRSEHHDVMRKIGMRQLAMMQKGERRASSREDTRPILVHPSSGEGQQH